MRTTATLYPGSLVLSFLSLREEPTTRTISLVMCENVRTVPEKESRVRWANPIGDEDDEDDEGEVHYLELFWAQDAGQQPVVIAVESIAERLAWVSSIWCVTRSRLSTPFTDKVSKHVPTGTLSLG